MIPIKQPGFHGKVRPFLALLNLKLSGHGVQRQGATNGHGTLCQGAVFLKKNFTGNWVVVSGRVDAGGQIFQRITGWWFQIFFIFTPKLEEDFQFD